MGRAIDRARATIAAGFTFTRARLSPFARGFLASGSRQEEETAGNEDRADHIGGGGAARGTRRERGELARD